MGRLLEQWMAENTAALQRLQPGGGMMPVGAAPEPAFPAGTGAMLPPPSPAFPTGAGVAPQAGPVQVMQTPGAEVGAFAPFQPSPMDLPAMPAAEAAVAGGPGPGGAVMDALEERRAGREELEEKVKEGVEGEVRLPEPGERS